ncbi:hypothetical protein M3Y96_00188700 [Aphelenchoides besseyi]|nr:hypothetical protein M3Y96_00188700 [Aphelenchoides besseyi]
MGDQYEPIGNLNDVPAVPPPTTAPPPVPPPLPPPVQMPKSAGQAPKSDFQQASAAPQVPEGQPAQSPAAPVQPAGNNNYEVPQFPPNQLVPPAVPTPPPQVQPLAETQGKKSTKAPPGENDPKTNLQSAAKPDPTSIAPANGLETATLNKPSDGDKSKFGAEEGSAKKKAAKGKHNFVKSYTISQCVCVWLWAVILMLFGGIITAGYLFVIFSSHFNPQ